MSASYTRVRVEPEGDRPWDAARARWGHAAPTGTRVRVAAGRWDGRVGTAAGTAWISAGGAGIRQVSVVDLDPSGRALARRITCYPSTLTPEEKT